MTVEATGPVEQPHAVPADRVLAALEVDPATGLSPAEAAARLARFGPNRVAARPPARLLPLLLHQFKSPVAALLAAAAAIACYVGELEEAAAIAVVLALNAAIGFVTELKATRSMEALRALGRQAARVRRDGRLATVAAEDLVPGDILQLEGGDAVAADLRLIEAAALAADESALTGESVPVDKDTAPVAADAPLGDRRSMLFRGTLVTRGSGAGVVTATGAASELGRIARMVEQAAPEASPLEARLSRLSGQLLWLTLGLALLIALAGLARGQPAFDVVEAAIALAVAAIPEGLPIVATLALARGIWRMARQNALIERLAAVETLGATTIILTDKTGTLTENRMALRRLWLPAGPIDLPAEDAAARPLLEAAALCSNAGLAAGPGEHGGQDSGDPMEVALLRAARAAGLEREALLAAWPELRELPFDSASKLMATFHQAGATWRVAVKGAPEAVLAACGGLAPAERGRWLERAAALGAAGLRVLALAEARGAGAAPQAIPGALALLGLAGLEDPPRPDVPAAIAACRAAGIRVVMVTGDHAVTALAIGRAVGLAAEGTEAIEGRALATTRPAALLAAPLFARVAPADKLALVRAHQAAGAVVAMTGDGVNDAPALKQADIGIAMGRRGTDVARQAAAMVLQDDAFPSIVAAIAEGLVIFDNLRRFTTYLLACNLSEVLVVGLALAGGLALPILPLQILFLNLVTDVFPAFALALGEGDPAVLTRPPRPPREAIVGPAQWRFVLRQGLLLTAASFAAWAAVRHGLGLGPAETVTTTFLTLALGQLWLAPAMRDPGDSRRANAVTRNAWVWAAVALCVGLLLAGTWLPPLAAVLGLVAPSGAMWAVVLAASLAPALSAVALPLPAARRRAG
jgi:Ca2+-transporting ATPase